ncbi:MAG: hypothetical protein ACXAC8_03005 [Candidatus Hodarchaeales archaeon]|jgi:hypothetical protein
MNKISSDFSEEKRILNAQLKEINQEMKVLDSIRRYYDKLGTFDSKVDMTFIEFNTYLLEHGYTQLREDFLEEINSKLKVRLSELERAARAKFEKLKLLEEQEKAGRTYNQLESVETDLKNLKQILFIPSWRKLIEKESFKGFYLNQAVYEILHDNVILLPDFAVTGLEDTRGESFIFLTGVGIYYVQFRLTPGEIIDDYREISGIILPLDVYEKGQDMAGSIIDSGDLIMTEYMINVPFSLFNLEQTRQMFLRGVIARNVYHPYKECFDKLLEVCQDSDSLNIEQGLKVLSGGLNRKIPIYTNEILTENNLEDYSKKTIAGIKNIQPKLDKISSDLQIQGLKKQIFTKIQALKDDFVNIGYPRLLDWIP